MNTPDFPSPLTPQRAAARRRRIEFPIALLAICLTTCVLGGAGSRAGAGAAPRIVAEEKWSNVFAGRPAIFHFTISAEQDFSGLARWRLSSGGVILLRGERAVEVRAGQSLAVKLELEMPQVKETLALTAVLEFAVAAKGPEAAPAAIEKPLWVFSADPFAHRGQWAQDVGIHLFDPLDKTAELLTAQKVPHRRVRNIESLADIAPGVLIVGEGISLARHRALFGLLYRSAAGGTGIVCLAPSEGQFALPSADAPDLPRPSRLSLRRGDVIAELDKRLDWVAWPPDGKLGRATVALCGQRGQVLGELREDADGWNWVEMSFPKGGSLAMCTFAIVKDWDATPAPRYLLAAMLQRAAADRVPQKAKETTDDPGTILPGRGDGAGAGDAGRAGAGR